MRFMHLSDLHIGKRLNDYSLVEDQDYILKQIAAIARDIDLDAVLVAGDVFDRAVPSVEALELWESFLVALSDTGVAIYVIAGNHDSAERLSVNSVFMHERNIYIAKAYSPQTQRFELCDDDGPVNVYLLPFIKPLFVRAAFPDADVSTYNEAVALAVDEMDVNPAARNVLVAHQFVTNGDARPETCDSETVVVGGLDNVEASLFDDFDYVALGHLHGRQSVRRTEVRYAGTPLKYSLSEAGQTKTVTIVTLGAKDDAEDKSHVPVVVEEVLLKPLRDLRKIEGYFADICEAAKTDDRCDDYVHVTLYDEALLNAMARLREYYPHVTRLDFRRTVQEGGSSLSERESLSQRSPLELFERYFEEQRGRALEEVDIEIVAEICDLAGGRAS